jgi:hypothetical protein
LSLDKIDTFTPPTVNGNPIVGGNLVITTDNCTEVTVTKGNVIVNDICLPRCYGCNERLTTGDIHLRLDALENP